MPSATLSPHPTTPCRVLRAIRVSVGRHRAVLRLDYVLEGDTQALRIPAPRPPRAADELWKHTCCELFVARPGARDYREFNFSPSGEWAAYRFSSYREGRAAVDTLPTIAVERASSRFNLTARVSVGEEKVVLGLSAVIEDESGALSYWALRHAPGKPDFHHPHAFAMELDAIRH
jgi:hypothetical protein